jgi:hypothetical protein
VPKADIGGIGRGFDFLGYQHSPQGLASKAAGEVRLNHNQIDPSSLSRRALAHGEAFLGGSWEESIVNNTEIAQAAAWLPVHMGNVGIGGFSDVAYFWDVSEFWYHCGCIGDKRVGDRAA